jgi:hypothetical protein
MPQSKDESLTEEVRKPNLFIVGAPRCGTTSMYEYLNDHPEIFMSPIKEPHYFGSDLTNKNRQTELEYLKNFKSWNDEIYAGEASIMYLFSQHAAKEIKEFNPAAKIIILLRNPVDFLNSYHAHLLSLGFEDIADLGDAMDAESFRRKGMNIPKRTQKMATCQILYYREVAAFSQQLERIYDVFDQDQVHVIIFDDLKNDTVSTYRGTLKFLGVDPDHEPDFSVKNARQKIRHVSLLHFIALGERMSSGGSLLARAFRKLILYPIARWNFQEAEKHPVPPQLRKKLQAEFAPEVERLSVLLGRDLSHWCEPCDESSPQVGEVESTRADKKVILGQESQ